VTELATTCAPPAVGPLLRDWRRRRRLSQLALALEAGVSARHLSFVETGRATPSREMVLRLAERLEVPLRERNALLLSAGYAPAYHDAGADDADALRDVRAAAELLLAALEPCPALLVNRHWTMLAANRALAPLLADVDAALLAPPVNALRASLHPRGLAPRVVNLGEWRAHVLARLAREAARDADPALQRLLAELRDYPAPTARTPLEPAAGVVVPLRLASPAGVLSFVSTTTVFSAATDVVVSELAIEAFLPADEFTRRALASVR